MAKLPHIRPHLHQGFARIEIGTMAKPHPLPTPLCRGFAHIEIGTMAKQQLREACGRGGLLTLKSELWQSVEQMHNDERRGLLTLKSELWQSVEVDALVARLGLLTLKSELWQSGGGHIPINVQVCSHGNLNYGKAYMDNLFMDYLVCSHGNLNYGKANYIHTVADKGFAHIEIGTMAKPLATAAFSPIRFAHIEIGTMAKHVSLTQRTGNGFAHIEIGTMAKLGFGF